MESYYAALLKHIDRFSKKQRLEFNSIYFGGGTPSVFGGERIYGLLCKTREAFSLSPDCEITVEVNPSSATPELFEKLRLAGVNRISMGVQSAVEGERRLLSRLSGREEVENALSLCAEYSFQNVSLDLMLGIPQQTLESLGESLDFILSSGCTHVSAYILKLEEGTALYKNRESLRFPDEDEVCDMYLHVCEKLRENGFEHYEISNFALPGYESRHNGNYWRCGEYLGLGPSAHSFLNGKRFYYKNSIESFLALEEPLFDCFGGDEEEFIMLALRLSRGLVFEEYEARYQKSLPFSCVQRAKELEKHGLLTTDKERIALTEKGFLLSNAIIAQLTAQC